MFISRKLLSPKVLIGAGLLGLLYLCYGVFLTSSAVQQGTQLRHIVSSRIYEWTNQTDTASTPERAARPDTVVNPGTNVSYRTPDGDCHVRNILASNFEDREALEALHDCRRVFYNRVPKCGSRTVLGTFKLLAKQRRYKLVDEERWNNVNYLETQDLQDRFAQQFAQHKPPFLYSQHVHYLNFTNHDIPPPVYINVVREPVDRLASHYYYNEFGSFSAPKEEAKTNMTLDECVHRKLRRCLGVNVVLPFFCGHSMHCQMPSQHSVQEAKRHLLADYLVVGLQEDMAAFMQLLELLMPDFFANATNVFSGLEDELKARYSTVKRYDIQKETVNFLKKHLAHEYDFYYFIKARFYDTLSKIRTRFLTSELDTRQRGSPYHVHVIPN